MTGHGVGKLALVVTTALSDSLGTMEGRNEARRIGMPLGNDDGKDEPDGAMLVLKASLGMPLGSDDGRDEPDGAVWA